MLVAEAVLALAPDDETASRRAAEAAARHQWEKVLIAEAGRRRLREEEEKQRELEEEEEARRVAAAARHLSPNELRLVEEQEASKVSRALHDADEMVLTLEKRHEDVHLAVESAGGFAGVIQMSKQHAGSAKVQVEFVALMRDICTCDEIAHEIAAVGGIGAILAAAHRHYDVPELIQEVADTMRNLSIADDVASSLSEAGTVEVSVDACARHAANADVSRSVVGALWSLSIHPELVPRLVELGVVQVVLDNVASSSLQDLSTQLSSVALLRNLTVNDAMRWTVFEHGGLAILRRALSAHPESTELAEHVVNAVWNLARVAELACEVGSSGVIDELLPAVQKRPEVRSLQVGLANCLRLCCTSPSDARRLVDAGGLQALSSASEVHAGHAGVQRAVLGAWASMACQGCASEVAASAALGLALAATTTLPKDAVLQQRYAELIGALTRSSDELASEIAADAGVLSTLTRAVKALPDNATLQAQVTATLAEIQAKPAVSGRSAGRHTTQSEVPTLQTV